MTPAQHSILGEFANQPQVKQFLQTAIEMNQVGQAYLFLGAPGSGKMEAAQGLAQALLCDDGGCGACDSCIRVAHKTHPDVHYYSPDSSVGYLLEQIRGLLEDVSLAPIRSKHKVYIIDRAELLRSNTANALLKTIEEPPANVTFILLGISRDTILQTIVSRCQCVPFSPTPLDVAAQTVERKLGVEAWKCRMAVSVTGSPSYAIEFLRSPERMAARSEMLRSLLSIADFADQGDVLDYAKLIDRAIVDPLHNMTKQSEKEIEDKKDFLSAKAVKSLSDRLRRETTHNTQIRYKEVLGSVRSLFRDVLLGIQDNTHAIINEDARELYEKLVARMDLAAVTAAIDAVNTCESRIASNVTPRLALEVMLLDIRKLLCL